MTAALLTRSHYDPPKGLPFIGDLALTPARVHEFCGPSRRSLALMLAARMHGHVFWIESAWSRDRLYAPGIVPIMDPARITFVRPHRAEDILWSMEEVLRNGAVPLVIAELPHEPPPLTPVRRLHLAAQSGNSLGVLLLAGDGGAQGTESRWHIAPRHHGTHREWMLSRRRARMAPPAVWYVEMRKGQAHLLDTRPPAT